MPDTTAQPPPPPVAYSPLYTPLHLHGKQTPLPSPESDATLFPESADPTVSVSQPLRQPPPALDPLRESKTHARSSTSSRTSNPSSTSSIRQHPAPHPQILTPQHPPYRDSRGSHRTGDVEKDAMDPFRGGAPVMMADASTVRYIDDVESIDKRLERKVVRIVTHLALLNPLVSLLFLLWTFFALLVILLLQPFRLCAHQSPFRTDLITFLSPALLVQLRLIFSRVSTDDFSPFGLVSVLLLGPIIAIGIALASWVVAVFMIFSAIIGDPGGKDGPNDAHVTVLSLREKWERWLLKALR